MSIRTKSSANPILLIARDWIQYVPTSVIPAFLALVASAIFTRMFPPRVYGLYSLTIAISIPVINGFSQPLSQPVGRFYYEYSSSRQMNTFFEVVSTLVFRIMAILVPVDALLGLWLAYSNRITPSLTAALMIFIVLQVMSAALMPIILSSFQTRHYQMIILGTTFLGVALPVALTMLLGHHISLLLWGNVIGSCLFLPLIVRWSQMRFSWRRKNTDHDYAVVLRRFLGYGLPFVPWFVAESMLYTGDRYILDWFHGPAMVAVYSVNYAMAQQVMGLLSGPFMTALWPRIMQQWSASGIEATRALLRHTTNIYLVAAGLVVGLIFVDGHAVMTILVGKQYVSGSILIEIIAIGRAIKGSSTIGHKTLELTERNRLMMWDAVLAAAINIGLNVWWIPHYGMVGASIAMTLSYLVYIGLIWYQSQTRLSWDISLKSLVVIISVTTSSVLVVHTVLMSCTAILQIPLATALFMILYGSAIILWQRGKVKLLKELLERGNS